MQAGGKSDHEAQGLKYFRAKLGDGDLTNLRLAE